eukprot:187687_1
MGTEASSAKKKISTELHEQIYHDHDTQFQINDKSNQGEKYKFSICSFNIWCPFWNDGNGVEANVPERWMKRHNSILNILSHSNAQDNNTDEIKVDSNASPSINADIYCLQEFWCGHKQFVNLYEKYLNQQNFAIYYLKRGATGKPDGVAIAFNKSVFKLINKMDFEYKSSNRVCLVMELQHIASGLHINIGNTHFTFPKAHNRSLRKALCTQFLDIMDKNTSNKVSLILLCGDYNCDIYETESILCLNKGYKSSFHIVNNSNMEQPLVSHFTHNKQSVFVDHIFYKGNPSVDEDNKFGVKPMESFLYPPNVATSRWPKENEWNLSDHRPLVTTFQIQDI